MYEDIWCLAAGFRSISSNCVRRSANSVAYALARFVRLIENEICYLTFMTLFLNEVTFH